MRSITRKPKFKTIRSFLALQFAFAFVISLMKMATCAGCGQECVPCPVGDIAAHKGRNCNKYCNGTGVYCANSDCGRRGNWQ